VVEPEPVALEDVVRRAWLIAGSETAALTVEGDLGTVQCDESRAHQLLENLFRNAVKHASTSPRSETEDAVEHASTSPRPPAGDAARRAGPEVTVRVGRLDAGFYVEDDGPGIPPEERETVFEYGYTTADEGTGFGLAIVRQIVEAHRWRIRLVEGSRGGARFEITGVERLS